MNEDSTHQTVLLEAAVNALLVDEDGIYIDGTFGRGGHSRLILSRLNARAHVFALDRDPAAVGFGKALVDSDPRFSIAKESFANLLQFAEDNKINGRVSGILLDLGVSSPQLDEASRGFSFTHDGPLDMRMDPESGCSAAAWINRAGQNEIRDVLKDYGEERYAGRIARAIVAARSETPITTTGRLAEIVKAAHPRWERDKHPATRSFQGIRIFINRELEALHRVLAAVLEVLRIGGRLVVISFHSLEDKIVKKFISLQTKGDSYPRGVPVRQSELVPTMKAIGKAIRPDLTEIQQNPRCRSAIMRVAERIA